MRLIIFLLALSLAACNASPASSPAAADIRAVMMREWNKPEAPLTVDPIVIVGAFAIADWTQPALGGRALLQRTGRLARIAAFKGVVRMAGSVHGKSTP